MRNLHKLLLVLSISIVLFSCDFNHEDENDNTSYHVDIATVENPNNLSAFFFRLDNDELMWTAESNFRDYKPANGQRIVAYYTLLTNKKATGLYDYDVKLEDAYEVLTKGVFNITPETQDSIGNDSITIKNMWIGNDYLNVQFIYTGNNKTHFINLVYDTSKLYSDGKIHLEFRHNSNGDSAYYYKEGIVSFNLTELRTLTNDTNLDLVIHVNAPNQAADDTYSITYNFGETTVLYRSPKHLINKDFRSSLQKIE